MGFSEAGLRRWQWTNVAVTLYAYFAETYLTFQGLNPRFSEHLQSVAQVVISIAFGIVSGLGFTLLYIVLLWVLFRSGSNQRPLMTLALRYGMGAVMLATAGGVWMVGVQGHLAGGNGDLLLIHALGFHGLQAVPLVAWLLGRAQVTLETGKRWVHVAGTAWMAATIFTGTHAAMGLSVATYSPALGATAVALICWGFTATQAIRYPSKSVA